MAASKETTISIEEFFVEQGRRKQKLVDQALDFLSHELAQELKKSWNASNEKIVEHAKNLILGEVDLDDNSVDDDEEEGEPSLLKKAYQENKNKFELIQKEHFLLLSAPITTTKRSQKAERDLRKFQYEQFCKASPLLQDESNYTEIEVTHEEELFAEITTYLRRQKEYLKRSIIFNGHGHKSKGFCLEGTERKYFVSLDRIKKKIFDLHKEFSHSLEQDTDLHFIQCWGHNHDLQLVDCHVKVISYTTEEQPKTINLKDGHSALITLAEQHVADMIDAVNSALEDTEAEPMEIN